METLKNNRDKEGELKIIREDEIFNEKKKTHKKLKHKKKKVNGKKCGQLVLLHAWLE